MSKMTILAVVALFSVTGYSATLDELMARFERETATYELENRSVCIFDKQLGFARGGLDIHKESVQFQCKNVDAESKVVLLKQTLKDIKLRPWRNDAPVEGYIYSFEEVKTDRNY